jgi:hypothetical protein
MPYIGKNGSDAVFTAFKHICRVLNRFEPKLRLAIDQAVTDGVISSGQRDILNTFLSSARAVCDIFGLVAGNSGV